MKEEENLPENYQWPLHRLVIMVKHEHCIKAKEVRTYVGSKHLISKAPI
jgi:hypothetical protein